ncbi:aromatic ring-hydroxylating oxygenase subunit alpha [Taylorella equigenitalis]|nr:aromatic ring-hydroxylating dioxygenase subunit alpha [Taylorella equigenitalis]WDU45925.1 aromatic ring-hydroxylating dioxygenase subunit alpha [Taylorella equigenitalis]WDU47459.1 aromatic ring-hydroxylating dioxygenase subunit alpha [Taylorella equigenitalis]WDU48914.1 aromatic ring-hydroxylating dioxygenase subunit alpha [Taylorella equigenitalis]WDU51389.1 aromatic ring-hydroxylating dioxygenase subunit alpha [Taylorella equigenitalis]WDU52953.1 aromatic ring-hydroxylating dioxygenase 
MSVKETNLSLGESTLPVAAYFDESHFALELEHIFKKSSQYVTHEKTVPNLGDWYTLPQDNAGRVLVHNEAGPQLISNVCRHRQALMLGGQAGNVTDPNLSRGNLSETGGNIVCPLHRWTYNNKGEQIAAPHFPENPCKNLTPFEVKNCHGLLFEGVREPSADMKQLFELPEFDFSDYVFDRAIVHECNYNWKTFIEVYLEDYHVEPFHPGLGKFVSCSDLQWDFSDWYSSQRVGVHQALANPGSPTYQKWHDALLNFRQGEAPNFGAVWVTYFPTHMIELYPHVLVLSTLYPKGPQKTLNVVEFYYPEEIVAFEREFIEAQQAAYMETAIEDDEIAERMDQGRLALLNRGVEEYGPYQSPFEDGMEHFHAWYRKIMP